MVARRKLAPLKYEANISDCEYQLLIVILHVVCRNKRPQSMSVVTIGLPMETRGSNQWERVVESSAFRAFTYLACQGECVRSQVKIARHLQRLPHTADHGSLTTADLRTQRIVRRSRTTRVRGIRTGGRGRPIELAR